MTIVELLKKSIPEKIDWGTVQKKRTSFTLGPDVDLIYLMYMYLNV